MALQGGTFNRMTLHSAASATANGGELPIAQGNAGTYSVASFQLTGTFTATITFEGTIDGTNWVSFRCANVATGAVATTATAAGVYRGAAIGFDKVRARLTWTGGTSITVTAQAAVANALDEAMAVVLAAGTNNIGDVDVLTIAAGDNNIGNVDVLSIAAGETFVGLVGSSDVYLTLTPVLDTIAYAAGDTLFIATELTGVGRTTGGIAVLQTLAVMDVDDQKIAMDVYFFDRTVTFGTINVAPSISDADTLFYMGHVSIAAGDYKDLGGASVAVLKGIALEMKPNATSLFVAAVTGGAPTHTASGLKFGFGFLR